VDARLKLWDHLFSSRAPVQLERVEILESNTFKPGVIDFSRATALVGSHGSGKTALLRMLNVALGGDVTVPVPPFVGRDGWVGAELALEGVVDVVMRTPAGLISDRVEIGRGGVRRTHAWPDDRAANSRVQYISPLTVFSGLEMLWDVYGLYPETRREHAYTPHELRALQNILGRRYDEARALEVLIDGDRYGWELYLPHFTAREADRVIDSVQMSSGELWVHYVLGYAMQDFESSALTLLDEPEAFLSQRGQRPFVDEIARLALAQKRQLVLATHSPNVFSRFPITQVRVCVNSSEGVVVYQPQSEGEVADSVGLQAPVRGLVAVEDENAARLFRAICTILSPGLDREFEIVAVGGEAEVLAVIRTLHTAGRLTISGVLDGDRRGHHAPPKYGVAYLPGQTGPEDELLACAANHVESLATDLNRTTSEILLALQVCSSVDHQYQLPRFAQVLGHNEAVVLHALASAWLRGDVVRAQAEEMLAAVAHRRR
jgi:energy-coupling factor transporter ATP-binding protein EcfA2